MIKEIKRLDKMIIGCINNDEKCREWLYRSFYGYLRGVAIRYTSNSGDVEELVNDSFVKIFKHLDKFMLPDGQENQVKAFKGWIAKITSRTIIDFLRINKNHFKTEEMADAPEHATPVAATDKMHVQDILRLLNELPEIQRIVFNMYEIEGYSHDEIAAELNIPAANSRVYLARAKNKLRSLYQDSFKDYRYA